jgi:SAM-dependent methyltransferase
MSRSTRFVTGVRFSEPIHVRASDHAGRGRWRLRRRGSKDVVADPPSRDSVSRPGPPEGHDFDAIYASSVPPWDIGRPQPDFEELARSGGLIGKVLDVGCGTGEHALLAAGLGHDVLGVDIAPRAIEQAKGKAAQRGVGLRFLEWDALRLPELGEQFDTVLDCGLFHIFDDDDRVRFVRSLVAVVPPGGRYHMLCFSDRQPGDWGPRRVTEAEIRSSFADGWQIENIAPTTIEITLDPAGALAWHATIIRS